MTIAIRLNRVRFARTVGEQGVHAYTDFVAAGPPPARRSETFEPPCLRHQGSVVEGRGRTRFRINCLLSSNGAVPGFSSTLQEGRWSECAECSRAGLVLVLLLVLVLVLDNPPSRSK